MMKHNFYKILSINNNDPARYKTWIDKCGKLHSTKHNTKVTILQLQTHPQPQYSVSYNINTVIVS